MPARLASRLVGVAAAQEGVLDWYTEDAVGGEEDGSLRGFGVAWGERGAGDEDQEGEEGGEEDAKECCAEGNDAGFAVRVWGLEGCFAR